MTKTITSLFFLFICYFGTSQVYWNGGAGKWSLGSNWSTGVIPTSADSVVIDTEDARVSLALGDYKIKALYLGFRSELTIDKHQSLLVAGGAGDAVTSLSGKLYVDGLLEVTNAARTGIILHARSEFTLARLTNSGLIHVSGSNSSGLALGGGRLTNNGKIISENNLFAGISTGHPSGSDINNDTIISRSNDGIGLSVNSGQEFANHGTILVSDNDSGLNIDGNLYNYNEIRISDSEGHGILVKSDALLSNSSTSSISPLIEVRNTNIGIRAVGGSIENFDTISIISSTTNGLQLDDQSTYSGNGFSFLSIDTSSLGIVAYGNANFSVRGSVIIKNSSANAVQQYGTSTFDFLTTSSITINNTGLSAYQLFDTSNLTFNINTSLYTENVQGSNVFSVEDGATLSVSESAEVTIGL